MRKFLLLLSFLLCGIAAFAIAPSANQTCVQNSTGTTTRAASLAVGTGDAVVVGIVYLWFVPPI